MMLEGVLIVDSGNRAWFERVLAAILYTYAFYLIVEFLINIEPELAEWYYISVLKVLSVVIVVLTFAVRYSLTKSFHFDVIQKQYRAYYHIGPFGYGKWESHLEFKSVVIYLNSNNSYLANIWDVKNNRITVGFFNKVENANAFGALLSKELNIKFQERKK